MAALSETELVHVLFGSETGTAEYCAEKLKTFLNEHHVVSKVVDMQTWDPARLADTAVTIVVTSTYGNGEAPFNAQDMLQGLRTQRPDLSQLRFAVMGLGDSSFENFAQCGRDFDAVLGDLGGTRLIPRHDADGDPDPQLKKFQDNLLVSLRTLGLGSDAPASAPTGKRAKTGFFSRLRQTFSRKSEPELTKQPTKSTPATGTLLSARPLSQPKASNPTRHYTLDLGAEGTMLTPGDAIGIFPRNDAALVDRIEQACSTSGPADREALFTRCLERVSPQLLSELGTEAKAIAQDHERMKQFQNEHHVLEALMRFGAKLSASDLVALLSPLAPRLYSVANHGTDGRIDLCVARTRFQLGERTVDGVATRWLETLNEGDTIRWYPHINKSFHLPDDDRPLILIGPGTGVAPFRGYLQQLKAGATKRDLWLFFGHRNQAYDDLYGDELQTALSDGVLTRYDVAWSRDGANKCYVQDLVARESATVWDWLQKGARVRVCGDASGMAPGVRQAFSELVTAHGEDGAAWLKQAKADKTYLEDVY